MLRDVVVEALHEIVEEGLSNAGSVALVDVSTVLIEVHVMGF